MRRIIGCLLVLTMMMSFSSTCFSQDLKIGYVDIFKVFNDYEKTKEYDINLEKRKEEAEKKLEEKKETIEKLQGKLDLLKEGEKAKEEEKLNKINQRERELKDNIDELENIKFQKEREVEDINQVIGYKARLLSILVPKYVAKSSKYGIAWLCVNQLRDEITIGQFVKAKELKFMTTGKSMPGGNVLKFNAFTLLELKTGVVLEPEKFGFEGMLFTAITVKNKLMPPNIKVEIVGDYVRGFNNFRTSYHFLMKNKRLVTGPWNYIKADPEKKKFRTKDAENLYNTDEVFRKEFDKAVKEVIQVEIIDKYNPKVN